MNDGPPSTSTGAPGEAELRASRVLAAEGFAHAFFTRRGGVSRPPWDTLSFAVSVGDEPEAVRENLARASRRLGVASSRIYFLSQVHGVDACVVDGSEDPAEVVRREGDTVLSASPGVACAVRTADCAPVLIGDRRSGAVAAVHSGWRGTVQDAVGHAIARLRALAGDVDLVAAIGPHIERCCFEVGEDVAAAIAAASRAGESVVSRGAREGKRMVDLRRVLRAQLEGAGVSAVDDVAGCTACDPARFHSFRRDGARSGRLLSAIVARS